MSESCREVNINGVKYVRETSDSDLKIVIAQMGWVFIGNYSEKNGIVTIKNASVIRRWGTTNGLGELAIKGPLRNTKLDNCPTIKIGFINIIAVINCEATKWK